MCPKKNSLGIRSLRYPQSKNIIDIFVSLRTLETSWNDRYLFEPVGPSLGRQNVVTEEAEAAREDIYKQQSQETTFNTFLGRTVERSQAFSSTQASSAQSASAGQLVDTSTEARKVNGRSSKKSSADNDNYYSKSSSFSSSYQKTNINGQEDESSSYNEHHYDSRNGESSYSKHHNSRDAVLKASNGHNGLSYNGQSSEAGSSSRKSSMATEIERRNERQRRESSRKASG